MLQVLKATCPSLVVHIGALVDCADGGIAAFLPHLETLIVWCGCQGQTMNASERGERKLQEKAGHPPVASRPFSSPTTLIHARHHSRCVLAIPASYRQNERTVVALPFRTPWHHTQGSPDRVCQAKDG